MDGRLLTADGWLITRYNVSDHFVTFDILDEQ